MRGRKPKGSERRGKRCDMTNIKERPDEIEGRLLPGHWEGDFMLGARGASAIGTLVERTTRYVVLVRMPTRKADVAACAFAGALNAIPAPLRKTLTYDQGKEMAERESLALSTGMRIFFADRHSPWQRGSNENTTGLLRQYFPKGTSLSGLTQDDLDTVAASLNNRPRKTLDYATPNEHFMNLLAELAGENQTVTRRCSLPNLNPPRRLTAPARHAHYLSGLVQSPGESGSEAPGISCRVTKTTRGASGLGVFPVSGEKTSLSLARV